MNQKDPYNAAGDASHPGVTGQPFASPVTEKASPEVAPGAPVDATGTGTFPPEQQGNVGRAQPAGLSAATEYGVGTSDSTAGGHHVANPITNPAPVFPSDSSVPDESDEEEDVPFDEQGK